MAALAGRPQRLGALPGLSCIGHGRCTAAGNAGSRDLCLAYLVRGHRPVPREREATGPSLERPRALDVVQVSPQRIGDVGAPFADQPAVPTGQQRWHSLAVDQNLNGTRLGTGHRAIVLGSSDRKARRMPDRSQT